MEEIWKSINYKSFGEIYEVSNTGKIKRKDKAEPNPGYNHVGYRRIKLSLNGKSENVLVHRIVALSFVENDDPVNKKEVNHIDGNKMNNHASNLEWCNGSHNSKHIYSAGLRDPFCRPISVTDVEGDTFEYLSQQQAAIELGINSRTIRDALKNGTKPFGWTIKYKNDKDIKVPIDLTGFKDIPNYTKYMINENGQIYGKKSMRLLQAKNKKDSGYIIFGLKKDGQKKGNTQVYLHRILAETFIPNPENLPEVNHIDHDRSNYSLTNLEWCSHSDNMKKCAINMKQKKERLKIYKAPILKGTVRSVLSKDIHGSEEISEVTEKSVS